MNKRLYIETWGCQMNEYDSKRIGELLEASHHFQLCQSAEEADLLIMNTCSIREKAEDKVYSHLGRWRILKEARPEILIAVGGCVASQEGAAIRQKAPFVDIVFGPQTLHRLPQLLDEVRQHQKPAMDISFPEIEKFDRLPEPKATGPTAFVSIQEGCTKYCAYCIVPYTRGEEVNRPFDDVIAEIATLASQKVKEITLLGQNVNAYRGLMNDGHIADLALLIRFVDQIEGIERIRFTTSHPNEFSSSLIAAYRDIPKLANHLHLPVQSGSDRILSLMGRNHTILEYQSKIKQLRSVRPHISLSSDFIVGYPGETEEDFNDTLNLVKLLDFDQSYSFMFSIRPGTKAATLPNQIPLEIKKQRLNILQAQLDKQALAHNQRLIGHTQRVLVTGPSKKDTSELSGRTESNRVVNFKGPSSSIGQIVELKITSVIHYTLRGEML